MIPSPNRCHDDLKSLPIIAADIKTQLECKVLVRRSMIVPARQLVLAKVYQGAGQGLAYAITELPIPPYPIRQACALGNSICRASSGFRESRSGNGLDASSNVVRMRCHNDFGQRVDHEMMIIGVIYRGNG